MTTIKMIKKKQNMHKYIGDTRYVDETKIYTNKDKYKVTADKFNLAYIDSSSDTVGTGCDAWVIEEVINRTVTITGYHSHCTNQQQTIIVYGVTAKTLPDGETVLIRVFDATILGEKANTLQSKLHLRKKLVDIDDRPRHHGEKSFFEKDGIIVPLTLTKGMMTLNISKPLKFGLNTCEVIELAKD